MSDRYQIQGKIGQGGLGAVYKAFDTQLKREVALKRVLTPEQASQEEVDEAAEKLMQEATVLSTLNHPNIVTVFDVGQDDSGGFVVMELLDGETLDQTISRGLLTLEDFTEVVNQTLEALIAAQAVNMMHRDLKPSNVMVIWRPSGKFQVKVLDFGLAKISESPSIQTIDQGDAILGSLYFMAPEQFERRRLDFRTDMYAMGCIYYNTLTGKYPFDGDTAPQVMAAHLQHKVKPVRELRPDLPEEVCQWVMWLINRDMTKRPSDAREALERYPGSEGGGHAYAAPAAPKPDTGRLVTGTLPSTGRVPGTSGPVSRATGSTGTIPRSATGQITTATSMVQLAEQEEARKRQMTVLLVSLVTGSLIIGVGIFLMMGRLQDAQEQKRIAELVSSGEGTAKDVSMLVKYLDPDRVDPRASQLLASLGGSEVEDAILVELSESKPGAARNTLLDVVGSRNLSEAFDEVLRIAKFTANPRERSEAIEALSTISRDQNKGDLLSLLSLDTLTEKDRRLVEDAVIRVILSDPSIETRVNSLLSKMDSTTGDERRSLCRIVGSAGGRNALARMERIFTETNDKSYQGDAVYALNAWPDRSCQKLLIDLMDKEGNSPIGVAATRAFIRIIGLPSTNSNDAPLWDRAFDATKNLTDINKVFIAIIDRPLPSTLNYLKNKPLEEFEALKKKAIERIETDLANAVPLEPGQLILADSGRQIHGVPGGAYYNDAGKYVENWTDQNTWIQWLIDVQEPGTYQVEIFMSCEGLAKSRYSVYFANIQPPLNFSGQPTGAWDNFRPLQIQKDVVIPKNKTGPQLFVLANNKVVDGRLMNVKGIRFTKVK